MGNEDKPRPTNSYSLLTMKMNEIQKSKRTKVTKNSNTVEKSGNHNSSNLNKSSIPPRKTLNKDQMSPPPKVNEPSSGKRKITNPNVPDRSYGDLFCPLCDSHMNSAEMWKAHITGKRHIKNVNKGNPDPKYEVLDVESVVMDEIRNVMDPIVGLSYIHEARRKDIGAPPMYTCFLCQATCATVPLVIEHVLTMKHRMNYIKESSPDDHVQLEATNLKKGFLESIVMEIASKLESKFGRGTVKVKQEIIKPTPITYSSRRMLLEKLENDDDMAMKNQKFEGKDSYSHPKEKDKYLKDMDKRQRNSPDQNFDDYKRFDNLKPIYDNPSRKYESPGSRDLPRKESYYPRKSVSPERYFPRTPRESRKDTHSSRSKYSPEPISRCSRSRSPPRDSFKDTYRSGTKLAYGPDPPTFSKTRSPLWESFKDSDASKKAYGPDPVSTYSSSRSHEERTSRSAENYSSSAEAKVGNSDSQILKDFVHKIYALPPEVFLRIVLLKLDTLVVKGIDELDLLCKVINKAQAVLCNQLPPRVQSVIKERLSQTSDIAKSSTAPSLSQISDSISFLTPSHSRSLEPPQQKGDLSFIKEFLHNRKENVKSSSVTSHQTPHQMPYQNQPYVNPSYQKKTNAAASYTNASATASYTNASAAASYTNASAAASYTNASAAETYQSANAAASYPNTNVAASSPNYSYNNAPPNTSGIPGLNLSDENRQSYTSYQTPYTATITPDQSSNYPPNYRY